jgi:cellulose synthase/poly-beta-1,6-N-acetylglucosamine synthase-like glycosyltransferase
VEVAQCDFAVGVLDREVGGGSADSRWPGAAIAAGQQNGKDDGENRGASHKAIIPNSGYGGARSSIGAADGVGNCAGAQRRSLPWSLFGIAGGPDSVSFEIIVVDDGSTDRTREIAKSFAGVRVVEPAPLPPGWIGKNNALVAGAKEARGEWLLFTDADTVHRAGSLARSLEEAQRQKAALLSYSPEQEVHGFWERAVMPVIFAELASSYRPSDVSDPASSAAAANGQYILISREAYDAVGGHEGIAASLLEDVALARAVKASGRKIFFRYGNDAVRTRMYRSFAQLRKAGRRTWRCCFRRPDVWHCFD